MEAPLIMRLMAHSVTIAKVSGSIIRKVLESGKLGVVDKGVNDLQTQADRSVQHCIVTSLSKKFPGINIIGEENLDYESQPFSELVEDMDSEVLSKTCPEKLKSISLEDIVVWVDPLDGTSEFASGVLEHVTILIGIAVSGRPVGGVVCQPFFMPDFRAVIEATGEQERTPKPEETSQRLVWGLDGLGVFGLTAEPISTAPVFASSGGSNYIVCTRFRSTPDVVAAIAACIPSRVYRLGGCGIKILMLLEGVAHAYLYANVGCKRWDTCAPEALLIASGGELVGMDGVPYSYASGVDPLERRGIVATANKAWTQEYLSRLPKDLVQKLRDSAPRNE